MCTIEYSLLCICMCIYIYKYYIYLFVCVHTYNSIYKGTCLCISDVYVYIYIHICICVHIYYVYIYIYIYIQRAGDTSLVLRRICQYQRSAFIDYHVCCGKCDPLTSDVRILVGFFVNATIVNHDGCSDPVQR